MNDSSSSIWASTGNGFSHSPPFGGGGGAPKIVCYFKYQIYIIRYGKVIKKYLNLPPATAVSDLIKRVMLSLFISGKVLELT
jgi:hypothetical protein